MRTRGSRVSRCLYSFHDVKQRSVLRSRGALLRSGLSAFVTFAFASASRGGRRMRLPAPVSGPFRRRTSMSDGCESVYYKLVT
jgi:hypothetical protein